MKQGRRNENKSRSKNSSESGSKNAPGIATGGGRDRRAAIPRALVASAVGVAVAILAAALWWRQSAGAIDVPEYVAEPCATWFREVPRYDPGSPPPGWSRILITTFEGERIIYGNIPGHYWRETGEPGVVCGLHYNTGLTSASGVHPDALLYLVEGRLVRLPLERDATPQPEEPWRVLEIPLADAPQAWLAERPDAPGYVYWRSYYHPQRRTAEPLGYWLRHIAIMPFTFDQGEPGGHHYAYVHDVEPGIDLEFAPKLNFDAGP